MAIDSKRIAKNTIFLYARLILVFGVTLFTSRVVLDKLGVDDYGLYNVVFSVIGMLSFLNGTLSGSTSRFITFDLGRGDKEKLKNTFHTTLFTHILLSVIILLLGESIGVWYISNMMVCPPERFHAAFIVYQLSILSTIAVILQVPFTAEIMAHEEMNIYAYIGIYEALAKLLIVYLLTKSPFDKLVSFGALSVSVTISVTVIYALISISKFEEVSIKIRFDKKTFKEILSFSAWNIIANLGDTLMKQGVIMLLNIFFLPVVVAARAISIQVSNAMMQFVNGVRQAINPQVIKSYADGRYDDSKRLTLESAEYVFDLLLILGIPLILIMRKFMSIWLVEVPEYAVFFTQLIIVQDILGNFSAAFYTPMVAANKIQKNTYASVILCLSQFGIMYILFRIGCGPLWAGFLGIVFASIWSFIVKPYILWKDVKYTWREMLLCISRCMRTFIVVLILSYFIYLVFPQGTVLQMLLVAMVSAVMVAAISLIFMQKESRNKIISIALSKIRIRH